MSGQLERAESVMFVLVAEDGRIEMSSGRVPKEYAAGILRGIADQWDPAGTASMELHDSPEPDPATGG